MRSFHWFSFQPNSTSHNYSCTLFFTQFSRLPARCAVPRHINSWNGWQNAIKWVITLVACIRCVAWGLVSPEFEVGDANPPRFCRVLKFLWSDCLHYIYNAELHVTPTLWLWWWHRSEYTKTRHFKWKNSFFSGRGLDLFLRVPLLHLTPPSRQTFWNLPICPPPRIPSRFTPLNAGNVHWLSVRSLASWFSWELLKLLPPDVRFWG